MTGTNGDPNPANNRGSRITASSFFTATGDAGSIAIEAGTIKLDDGARISTSTSGIGDGGPVQIVATGAITLVGARGDGQGSAIKASTEVEAEEAGEVEGPRTGHAGNISIQAPSLTLADGAEIVGNTSLAGNGGEINIAVDHLEIANARIASESTGAGADAGAGGDVVLSANTILLRGGALLSASSTGVGDAGTLAVTAQDSLTLDAAAIRTSAAHSAGGDIVITAGRQVMATDSLISAEAGGVTPERPAATSSSIPSS